MAPNISPKDPRVVLEPLFTAAKQVDEFEYCCTLLRVRGIEGPGWDPLRETMALTQQLLGFLQAPLDPTFQLRLTLFLYCHLTEVEELYRITANLLQVKKGERYNLDPGSKLRKPSKEEVGRSCLNSEIIQLIELSEAVGMSEVGELFSSFYVRQVRNAFFHSDYVLAPDSFNIRNGEGVNLNGSITQKVEFSWLVPRIELGINTALAILQLVIEGIGSYTQNKVVRGRFAADGSHTDIELAVQPGYGLVGFRSPVSAGQ